MYDHNKQYRCTIIRGKSKKEMDDLLPAYASVIDEICPCRHEDFESLFNNAFQRFLPESDRIKRHLIIIEQKYQVNYLGCIFMQKMVWFMSQNVRKSIYLIVINQHF